MPRIWKNFMYWQEMLYSLNPSSRKSNSYCKPYKKIVSFKEVEPRYVDRYMGINARSLDQRSTLELRMHSGSTNSTKIINWVKLLWAISELNIKYSSSFVPSLDALSSFQLIVRMSTNSYT